MADDLIGAAAGRKTTTGVSDVVSLLADARSRIESSLGVASAELIVNAVLRGQIPREGRLTSGEEYLVHGVGYTVVLPDGRLAHLDAHSDGEECSVHGPAADEDVRGRRRASLDEIAAQCDALCDEGVLVRAGSRKYVLPR